MFPYSFSENKTICDLYSNTVNNPFQIRQQNPDCVSLLQISTITVTEHISNNDQFQILDPI